MGRAYFPGLFETNVGRTKRPGFGMGLIENMIGLFQGPSDEALMERAARADDAAAFAELMRRWEPAIQNLCHRILSGTHQAKDATQEAFTRVYLKRRDFRPGAKFSTFLRRVATNLCLDELRRAKRRRETSGNGAFGDEAESPGWEESLPSREPGPAEAVEMMERSEAVRSALAKLPENLRAVVSLKHYESLTFREVAEVLEIPEGTAKSRMVDALTLLRKYLPEAQFKERRLCEKETRRTPTLDQG